MVVFFFVEMMMTEREKKKEEHFDQRSFDFLKIDELEKKNRYLYL